MLCCPARSPRSLSNRFPGGTLSSARLWTRFSCVSFRRATGQRATGQARRARRLLSPLKRSSVAPSANERITNHIITHAAIARQSGDHAAQAYPGTTIVSPGLGNRAKRHCKRRLLGQPVFATPKYASTRRGRSCCTIGRYCTDIEVVFRASNVRFTTAYHCSEAPNIRPMSEKGPHSTDSSVKTTAYMTYRYSVRSDWIGSTADARRAGM